MIENRRDLRILQLICLSNLQQNCAPAHNTCQLAKTLVDGKAVTFILSSASRREKVLR
jgi:hypothetical protein